MAKVFVDWEEIFVSNDKGSRVVHYYLKDTHGNSDLAVVGREKSLRHMVYTVPSQFLRLADVHGFQPASSLKWRSRREVVDWLSSLIADYASYQASPAVHLSGDDEDPFEDPFVWKGHSSKKSSFHSKEFTWLGSSWNCRKRRKHYRAFNRNGIKISVHDFVYVMSEENRRLVAYLEDMYEDSRSNKMVVVRWFNNGDEVGIVSPPQFSDREIFFSLCLQDLSVECVDGLATILSSQHFEKYLKEAMGTRWKPFLCCRLVDGADIKPFDMTQLQGYWNQTILRHMYSSRARSLLKPVSPSYFSQGEEATNTNKNKSKVKGGISLEWKSQAPNLSCKWNVRLTALDTENLGRAAIANGAEMGVGSGGSVATRKITTKLKPQQQFSTGCQIEVLSQDSGVRGCWFTAVILKRHGDKVKVQYQDLFDADETGKLEEWVLLSRVATGKDLGIRVYGRTTVRPCPPTKCRLTKGFDVGTVVDARWHDGWWEGIVVLRETEDKVHVYFPGERKIQVFETNSLRHSQEWFSNKWSFLKERPDVARSVNPKEEGRGIDRPEPSDLHERGGSGEAWPFGTPKQEASAPSDDTKGLKQRVGMLSETAIRSSPSSEPPAAVERKREREAAWPVNLEKDNLLAHLKWNPSKKRRRGSLSHKSGARRHSEGSSSSSRDEDDVDASPGTSFLIPSDMKVDVENCKYGRTTPLVIANMPPLSSLVMSR